MKQIKEHSHEIPMIQKEPFKKIYVVYFLIVLICIFSIGIALYQGFFKDEKIGVSIGLVEKEDEEVVKINGYKENFLNLFDNSIKEIEPCSEKINKIMEDSEFITIVEHLEENKDNYMFDINVPFFNIKSNVAVDFNKEINQTFNGKQKSILDNNDISDEKIIFNVRYKAFVYKDIISLVVMSELKEGENNERIIVQTYNYNIKENKKCTFEDFLNLKQIDTKDVQKMIKKEIDESQEQNVKINEAGYDVKIRNSKDDFYKVENIEQFFIGEDGLIYIVYAYGNKEFTSEMNIVIL